MIYKRLETYDNGKLKECPICQNEETNIEGDFCQICGTSLVNHCSNEDCPNSDPLPSNARYCPLCGTRSTFYRANILLDWNAPKDPFMTIPDGIDEELPFN